MTPYPIYHLTYRTKEITGLRIMNTVHGCTEGKFKQPNNVKDLFGCVIKLEDTFTKKLFLLQT